MHLVASYKCQNRLTTIIYFSTFSGTSKVNGVDPRTFIVLDRLYGTLGDKLITWRADIQSLTRGLLRSRRRKKEIDLLWNDRLLAMYDIARALKYLHSKE